MHRVAIIGGGITGLSAAYYLERARRQGATVEYVLYESSPRLGGVAQSETQAGFLLEAGPDSFLSSKPWARELAEDAGIEDQLIGSQDHLRRTLILCNGGLLPLPDGLQFVVPTKMLPVFQSPLFSLSSKLRMTAEAGGFFRKKPARGQKERQSSLSPEDGGVDDESAASFVERHFGPELVDRVVDPLLAGVYGGEARYLSSRAVLPTLVEMESKYGSLSRGFRVRSKRGPGEAAPASIFTSFRGGIQQLIDAVHAGIAPEAIRLRTSVTALRRAGQPGTGAGDSNSPQWELQTSVNSQSGGDEAELFDSIVLALPAYAAAQLLLKSSPVLSGLLNQIPYSSSVVVLLAFEDDIRNRLPAGFGFLVPRTEGKRMLACTFVHNKFPFRVPEGGALLRVFFGGSRDEEAIDLGEEEIVSLALRELKEAIGLTAKPSFARVYRWPKSMAQYQVGHIERIAEINRLSEELPGILLAGNAYRGIGLPDCVRSGREAAGKIIGERGGP